jgi:DNA-binding transcriptional LysR family regulator
MTSHSELIWDPLSDSTLVQRTLAPAPWYLFAAPGYLDRHGLPLSPERLTEHHTLVMMRHGQTLDWKLKHSTQGEVVVPLKPRLAGNDIVTLKQAAEDGLGIVALPAYVCRDDVKAGRLKHVLPDWLAGEANITAVVPFRHGMLPSVRVFLDFLAETIPKVVS